MKTKASIAILALLAIVGIAIFFGVSYSDRYPTKYFKGVISYYGLNNEEKPEVETDVFLRWSVSEDRSRVIMKFYRYAKLGTESPIEYNIDASRSGDQFNFEVPNRPELNGFHKPVGENEGLFWSKWTSEISAPGNPLRKAEGEYSDGKLTLVRRVRINPNSDSWQLEKENYTELSKQEFEEALEKFMSR